jgi:hypothetical protein
MSNHNLMFFSILIFLVGCTLQNYDDKVNDLNSEGNPDSTEQEVSEVIEKMTFRVQIPENTPPEDSIYISLYTTGHVKMDKIEPLVYEAEVFPEDIDFVFDDSGNKIVWYAYVRNNINDSGAPYNTEFISGTPNTNNYFWTRRGRETIFEPDKLQDDTIVRWLWFPKEGWANDDISDLGPDREFKDRLGNERFKSGQGLMDEYHKWLDPLFKPTARHMLDKNYEWIAFFPAWDWENDLPKIRQLKTDIRTGEILGFPDNKMRMQIREFKQEGLKVILAPQICCTQIAREGRSEEWWDQYWKEVKKVYVHYANLAEDEEVEVLVNDFAPIGNTEGMGEDIANKEQDAWEYIWNEVDQIYNGEKGQMVWYFGERYGGLTPSMEFITWNDKIDLIYLQSVGGLTFEDNPSNGALEKGAGKHFAKFKELYEMHKKPLIIQTNWESRTKSWHGFKPGNEIDFNVCDDDDSDEECDNIFSGRDQARSVDAYFSQIAESPWVIGYLNFGYRPEEIPLKPEWSVRGKAAEELWEKWNHVIYKDKE